MNVEIEIPEKLEFLLQPATTQPKGGRFKVIHGGRGGAKSESVARALLVRGMAKKVRVLCAREIQNSIKDSVHQLLRELIDNMGLNKFYHVQENGIYGANGTEFLFKGLKFNSSAIKSIQSIDICWVEEADKVSAGSWKYLIPTIRAEYPDGTCSEIIIIFNPELEDDYTYQNFVVKPPASAIVVEMNWRDNLWFPNVLESERAEMEADPKKRDEYLWTWEGKCKQTLEGAVYADELRKAEFEGRLTSVPVQRGVPVQTFWDLGRGDKTAIWFIQRVSLQWRAVDYYENSGKHIDHYLLELQERGYVYGTFYLPHDAEYQLLGQKRTIAQQVRNDDQRVVRIIKRPTKKANGINAGRSIFAETWFDREKCADGLNCLRRYRYGVSDAGTTTREPLHDEYSHGADAWQTFGLSGTDPKPTPKTEIFDEPANSPQAWMG